MCVSTGRGLRTNSLTRLVWLGVRECQAAQRSRGEGPSRRLIGVAGRSPARCVDWDIRADRPCANGRASTTPRMRGGLAVFDSLEDAGLSVGKFRV